MSKTLYKSEIILNRTCLGVRETKRIKYQYRTLKLTLHILEPYIAHMDCIQPRLQEGQQIGFTCIALYCRKPINIDGASYESGHHFYMNCIQYRIN